MTVTAYNFAQPARLPGDAEPRLTVWLSEALKLVSRAWTKDLGFEVAAEPHALELSRWKDVLERLSETMTGYRVLLGQAELPTMLLLPRPLLAALIASLLGETADAEQPDRELTVVEQSLAEYFLQTYWLPFFKDTWPAPLQVIHQLGQAEPAPRRSRALDADEPVVCFSWRLKTAMGEQPGYWIFRRKGLAPLLGLNEESAPVGAGPAMDVVVRNLPLDFSVQLGSVELRLSQLSHLRPGDLILLDQRVGEPLQALVGDKRKFRGWGGRSGLTQAFQIDSLADE